MSDLMWKTEKISELVDRLRECANSGADPTKWDYITLMQEAADALEFLEEIAKR